VPDTFIKIASVTVGSGGVASVTLSSIPNTYTDLVVKGSVRATVSADYEDLNLEFNSSNISSRRRLGGNGSVAFSDFYSLPTPGISVGATATANVFSNFELYIANYAGSTDKSFSYDTVTENNATAAVAQMVAGIWNSSAAITSMTFYVASANLVQYSTFTLYGVSKS